METRKHVIWIWKWKASEKAKSFGFWPLPIPTKYKQQLNNFEPETKEIQRAITTFFQQVIGGLGGLQLQERVPLACILVFFLAHHFSFYIEFFPLGQDPFYLGFWSHSFSIFFFYHFLNKTSFTNISRIQLSRKGWKKGQLFNGLIIEIVSI